MRALILGALAGALSAFIACAALPDAAQQSAVAAYEADQLNCVAEAGTRLEADRCRCAVKQRYGRPCTTMSLDGGAE